VSVSNPISEAEKEFLESLRCMKCSSQSTQRVFNDATNKINCTCLICGHTWIVRPYDKVLKDITG